MTQKQLQIDFGTSTVESVATTRSCLYFLLNSKNEVKTLYAIRDQALKQLSNSHFLFSSIADNPKLAQKLDPGIYSNLTQGPDDTVIFSNSTGYVKQYKSKD